jgi:hypothetical protein
MSALPPKADMVQRGRDVRFVPIADIPSASRRTIKYVTDPGIEACYRPDYPVRVTPTGGSDGNQHPKAEIHCCAR